MYSEGAYLDVRGTGLKQHSTSVSYEMSHALKHF